MTRPLTIRVSLSQRLQTRKKAECVEADAGEPQRTWERAWPAPDTPIPDPFEQPRGRTSASRRMARIRLGSTPSNAATQTVLWPGAQECEPDPASSGSPRWYSARTVERVSDENIEGVDGIAPRGCRRAVKGVLQRGLNNLGAMLLIDGQFGSSTGVAVQMRVRHWLSRGCLKWMKHFRPHSPAFPDLFRH